MCCAIFEPLLAVQEEERKGWPSSRLENDSGKQPTSYPVSKLPLSSTVGNIAILSFRLRGKGGVEESRNIASGVDTAYST